jgi:hypothetical protein
MIGHASRPLFNPTAKQTTPNTATPAIDLAIITLDRDEMVRDDGKTSKSIVWMKSRHEP